MTIRPIKVMMIVLYEMSLGGDGLFLIKDIVLTQDLVLRHKKVREMMVENALDAILITGIPNLYYLTGQILMAYLYFPRNDAPLLFFTGSFGEESEDLIRVRKPEEIPGRLQSLHISAPSMIGLEEGDISAAEWKRLSLLFPGSQYCDASNMLREVRAVKTPLELEWLKETGQLHGEVYAQIPSLYRRGMTDVEFSAAIEHLTRIRGGLGLFRTYGFRMEAFMGTVLAGENGCMPTPYDFSLGGEGQDPSYPLGPSGRVMKVGETVVVDVAMNKRGYLTDLSRTFAVEKATEESLRLQSIAIKMEQEMVKAANPGVPSSDIYQIALDIAAEKGVEDIFMGREKQAAFVGHGIGIEINELPVLTARYRKPLKENMVIAIEPKLIGPNGPVGVENSYLIEKEGAKRITPGNGEIVILES